MLRQKEAKERKPASGCEHPLTPEAGKPTCEEIAKRAYDLYLKRGAASGGDLADWFEAEEQIQKERVG